MKTLKCIETGKKTKFDETVPDYELDDVLDVAANRILKQEPEHKHDFICIRQNKMQSEICYALPGLTEHTGEYRMFEII